MFLVPINLTGFSLGPSRTDVLATQMNLDFNIWVMKAALQQNAGGTLDYFLQSQDIDGGPWCDIAHLPQLAAGAALFSYRLGFYRGLQSAQASQVVNTLDLTPVLAAGTILTWANGKNIRLVCVAGAGVTAGTPSTITGFGAPDA